jgi:hypothetical protein
MATRRRRSWPPPGVNPWRTSVDYLAFAAAQPELERRAARVRAILLDVAESSRRNWRGPIDLRAATLVRIEAYVMACYAVSERFTGEDCNVLRLSGILPRQFFADVESEVRAGYRAQRRDHSPRRVASKPQPVGRRRDETPAPALDRSRGSTEAPPVVLRRRSHPM